MAYSKSKQARKKPVKKITAGLMDELKMFTRTRGIDFLKQPNITSIGIGYKEKTNIETGESERTDEISIQFTVEKKLSLDLLPEMDVEPIPASINIGGVEIITDVLQRNYVPSFKVVTETNQSLRKQRIDPVQPGISIGHEDISAGTLGCIVYDNTTGAPYALSNWHVLQGTTGEIGDQVVQPGPHDDNRLNRNQFGKVVRSHLGPAGDCAVASIDERAFNAEILDLGVTLEKIGEPELGDKVVKSGRTTNVTHGIVSRIHTVTRLNYGGNVGQKIVGGFEIEPDPENPARGNEISMGGDSGSAWIFKSDGEITDTLAGLHFAGEGRADPNERALACYAQSVFEKLNITFKRVTEGGKTLRPPELGYNEDFLGEHIPVPALTCNADEHVVLLDNDHIIPYTHFSLALHKERRFAMWVAWNIDGARIRRVSRRGISFVTDPRIPKEFQVDNSLYTSNPLDRGHLARRADLCWGAEEEAIQANRDSFFYTNIAPQMDDFNRSSESGIWGQLENAVFSDVRVEDLKVSVFGGPVFRDDDRVYRDVKIPREYFKVIAFKEDGKVKVRAFLLTQNLTDLEALDLDEFKVFQVTLNEIESRCDFRFPSIMHNADDFAEFIKNQPETIDGRPNLVSESDIVW